MPDYTKTVIYKLINYDCQDLVYVGSTTNFTKRKAQHKQKTNENVNRKLYNTIREKGGWESWNMIKICDFPCNTSAEARQEEDRHMILLKSNLNSYRAYMSDEDKKERNKKYRIVNKEKIQEVKKQYMEANKEKIAEQQKQYNKLHRKTNKEKQKEYHKQYYEQHKEKIIEDNKKYREANKEKIQEAKKERYRKTKKEKLTTQP